MRNEKHNRGYAYEYYLVKKFKKYNRYNGVWDSRRLGGSSVGLPDLVSVNNDKDILICIEAKSRSGNYAEIEKDQIDRCYDITHFFTKYKHRFVVFAFKFLGKHKDKKTGKFIKRELKEYYVIIDTSENSSINCIEKSICNYVLGPKLLYPKNLIFTEKYTVQHSFDRMIKYITKYCDKKENEFKRIKNMIKEKKY